MTKCLLQRLLELLDSHTGVSNECAQQSTLELSMIGHGQRNPRRRRMAEPDVAAALANNLVPD